MEQTLKRLIEDAAFRETRRGYDRGEVDDFLDRAAAMAGTVEAQLAQVIERGRAAEAQVKRLEAEREVLQSSTPAEAAAPPPAPAAPAGDVTEEVARTLVLAQRTADAAVAEAREEAARIVADAEHRSQAMLAEAADEAQALRERVRAEADEHRTQSRAGVEAEVRALSEAREALAEDLATLEAHVGNRHDELRRVVDEMHRLLEQVAAGRLEVAPLPTAAPEEGAWDDDERHDAGRDELHDDADEWTDGATPDDGGEPPEGTTNASSGAGAAAAIVYDERHAIAEIADAPSAGDRVADPVPVVAADDSAFAPTDAAASVDLGPEPLPDWGAPPAPGSGVVINDVDHGAPGASSAQHDAAGPPTQEVSVADLGLDDAAERGGAEEDEFLAELRKAIYDDEPLGPRRPEGSAPAATPAPAPAPDPRDQLFGPDDRRGRKRGDRFGRRR